MPYDHASIEPKWQQRWLEQQTFRVKVDPSKPKYYVLDMFPYPSGAGLHVGHPKGYTATDVVARWKRMQGFNVLHPMGWDAFGLPAERSAVRENIHPAVITKRNVANFKRQLQRLGFSYDWSRELSTTDEEYYRWTQWIFLKLYEKGLAYQAEVAVNWCPALGTVLANEEVQDGKYVETGDPVEKRSMRQWMMKITAYAERLISDLDGLDWPESLKEMQRNWIGRSEGADVTFKVAANAKSSETFGEFVVFTTRPDTLFGATYCVLAPEHALVAKITTPAQKKAVESYVAAAKGKPERDRMAETKEKTGVFTGAYAINPATKKPIPIWVADYVLAGYGTGAIMAVPGHDERDHQFARTFDLPIVEVVRADLSNPTKPKGFAAFDVNAYRRISSGLTRIQALAIGKQLRELDEKEGRRAAAAPSVLIELLARLRRDDPHRAECHAALCVLWEHCIQISSAGSALRILGVVDLQLEKYVREALKLPRSEGSQSAWLDVDEMSKCCQVLALHDLDSVPAEIMNGVMFYSDFVRQQEESFAANVRSLLTSRNVARETLAPGVDPKKLRQIELRNIESSDFRTQLALRLVEAAVKRLVVPVGEPRLRVLAEHLLKVQPTAFVFWQDIVRKCTLDQVNIDKPNRKNWVWDFLFAFNIGSGKFDGDELVAVTDDGEVLKAANSAGMQSHVATVDVACAPFVRPFVDDGVAVNSGFLDGLSTNDAKAKMTEWVEKQALGRRRVQYKLRDWLFSRQRYWGEPFPILHLADGTTAPVPYDELPVLLPPIDEYKPTADGQPPLARATEWVKTTDRRSGKAATRETNTMPQWAGSCWYYLRFVDPKNGAAPWSKEAEQYWMPVDLYVGGVEHAVLHLLYARFWHKVLFDLGLVTTKEPFQKLRNQGLITAHSYQDAAGKYYYPDQVVERDGKWFVKESGLAVATQVEKMSKSRFNVVSPDDVIRDQGADSMRLYECFIGPLKDGGAWQTNGVEGMLRFLERTWRLYFTKPKESTTDVPNPNLFDGPIVDATDVALEKSLHKTIKKVTEDLEAMSFNTAISAMMVFVNEATGREKLPRKLVESFILLLAPFAPHLCEEVWAGLGHELTIAYAAWPKWDPALVRDDTIEIGVQVNGKLRDTIAIPADADAAAVQEIALASEKVQKALEGKTPKKVIVVPRKIVSVVV